jgi:hypothetical protein
MLLQDNAATWWMSIRRDGTEPKRWIDFKQQITQQFKNIDSNRRARDRLEGLKQTTSVRNFIKFFEDLIYEIEDIGHSEQYWKFRHGLNDSIKRELDKMPTQPSTLEELKTMAQRIDDINFYAD